MAVLGFRTTFKYATLEECFGAPLNSLRYNLIAYNGYKQGVEIFHNIIQYHYFQDYELYKNLCTKYNIKKPFT